jgi:WD40 repeat protein
MDSIIEMVEDGGENSLGLKQFHRQSIYGVRSLETDLLPNKLIHTIKAHDRQSGKHLSPQSTSTLSFSSDGSYIVTGGADCSIKLWNAQSGELVSRYQKLESPVTKVKFAQIDIELLAVASLDS